MDVVSAFVATMVWGHGESGYGPYRTARILSGGSAPSKPSIDGRSRVVPSAQAVERLGASAELVRSGGAPAAYRYLNARVGHVAGLGPAFFTKWLYFATAGSDPYGRDAAPILDALVLNWLNTHAGTKLRAGYTDEYARYIDLLGSWAPDGFTPVMVEATIFRLAREENAAQG